MAKTNSYPVDQDDDGLVGSPDGVDINSAGYQRLRETIKARSAALTEDQKREIEFNTIRYRMMEYVQSDDNKEVMEPGDFIRQYLEAAKNQAK